MFFSVAMCVSECEGLPFNLSGFLCVSDILSLFVRVSYTVYVSECVGKDDCLSECQW